MAGNVSAVVKREFLTRIRSKGFLVGLVLFPVFMVAMVAIPVVFSSLKSEKQHHFVVIDLSGKVLPLFRTALRDTTKDGKPLFVLMEKKLPAPANLDKVKQELNQLVEKKEIEGYLIIPEDVVSPQDLTKRPRVEFYSKKVTDFTLLRSLSSALNEAVRALRFRESGIDPALVRRLLVPVDLRTFKLAAGKAQEDRGFTFGVTYILALSLYMGLLLYGVMIMRSVLEEKTDRVVEMIVSSVKPFQLMTGKLIGVGGVGLVQFSIWGVFLFVLMQFKEPLIRLFGADPGVLPGLPSVPVGVIVFFVVFFVLGFFLYATLYAAVGAMVSSEQDAQQLQTPIIMFLIIPVLLMMPIMQHPESQLAVILSLIPFFAPIIMFMRISVLVPPVWQIALSLALLVLTIWFMLWLAGKIYRVGILMYGKRPSLGEVVKWVRFG